MGRDVGGDLKAFLGEKFLGGLHLALVGDGHDLLLLGAGRLEGMHQDLADQFIEVVAAGLVFDHLAAGPFAQDLAVFHEAREFFVLVLGLEKRPVAGHGLEHQALFLGDELGNVDRPFVGETVGSDLPAVFFQLFDLGFVHEVGIAGVHPFGDDGGGGHQPVLGQHRVGVLVDAGKPVVENQGHHAGLAWRGQRGQKQHGTGQDSQGTGKDTKDVSLFHESSAGMKAA